jgi:hypothetical protein
MIYRLVCDFKTKRFTFLNLEKRKLISYILIGAIIIGQVTFVFLNGEQFTEKRSGNPNYKQFYATELFDEIKSKIGGTTENYRVVSIGIHPSIAQYNGFYTLDGYLPSYPIEYKNEFRKIIRYELAKNKDLRVFYDYWGSKFYVFVNELGRNFTVRKDSNIKINKLHLDTNALKNLGGRYIFSAVEIVNYQENNLEFLGEFNNENSAWKIYLYEVK